MIVYFVITYLLRNCFLCSIIYECLPQSLTLNEARFSVPQISLCTASQFLSNVLQMIHWPAACLPHGAFLCHGAILGTANLSREGFQLIALDLVDVVVLASDALLWQLLSLPKRFTDIE